MMGTAETDTWARGSSTVPDAGQSGRRHQTFPMRALLERVRVGGDNLKDMPWCGYLPINLQPKVAAGLSPSTPQSLQAMQYLPAGTWLVASHLPTATNLPILLGPGMQPAEQACTTTPSTSLSPIAGKVWRMSQEPAGCREVQRIIETAESPEMQMALANELHGHVLEALRSPHANHVMQKVIKCFRPQALQFIVDEISNRQGAIAQAARHKYGCRILQRLLEECLPEQVQRLVDVLIADALELSVHNYGNYVMQHVLEYGTPAKQLELVKAIEKHLGTIGHVSCGSAVISAAMAHAGPYRTHLAQVILEEPQLLTSLAHVRHGHLAVHLVLEVLEGPERQLALSQLRVQEESLEHSRSGRSVVVLLESASTSC